MALQTIPPALQTTFKKPCKARNKATGIMVLCCFAQGNLKAYSRDKGFPLKVL